MNQNSIACVYIVLLYFLLILNSNHNYYFNGYLKFMLVLYINIT